MFYMFYIVLKVSFVIIKENIYVGFFNITFLFEDYDPFFHEMRNMAFVVYFIYNYYSQIAIAECSF